MLGFYRKPDPLIKPITEFLLRLKLAYLCVASGERSGHGRLLIRVRSDVVIGHRLISSPGSAKPQLNAALASAAVVM